MNSFDAPDVFGSHQAVYKPYKHQDYYAMDSLYLSPLQQEEVWDFQALPQMQLAPLGFLVLRSLLREKFHLPPLEWLGLSNSWKTFLAKEKFLEKPVPVHIKEFIPTLLGENSLSSFPFSDAEPFEKEITMEQCVGSKKNFFFVGLHADGEQEKSGHDLMRNFLTYSKDGYELEKAYIRKANGSYLYLRGKDSSPRIYFKELVESDWEGKHFQFILAELDSKLIPPK